MKTHNKWTNIIGNMDMIDLAKLICKAMYSGTATEAPTQTYLKAEVILLTY